jgi:hypothetical protein
VSTFNRPVSGELMLRWVSQAQGKWKDLVNEEENKNSWSPSTKQFQDGAFELELDNWGSNPTSDPF